MRCGSAYTVSLMPRLGEACMEVMTFLNEAAERYPQAISLAAGRPPDRAISDAEIAGYIGSFVRQRSKTTGASELCVRQSLGQYGATNGMICDLVARFLERDEGLSVDPSTLMITNGMQEAVLLLLLGTCDANRDVVLSDEPTYVGLTGAAALLGIPVMGLTGRGTALERVSQTIESARRSGRRPRALYLIPDFSNPLGTSLSLDERRALLELARREEILLIEDTAYRAFRYEGVAVPCLKALDEYGVVVQVGSFSKVFMPGTRVGYLCADQRVSLNGVASDRCLAEELAKAKSFVSVLTSPLAQAIVGGFLLEHDFSFEAWNRPRVEACGRNLELLISLLEREFSADSCLGGRVDYVRPRGGFFLVLGLPFPFGTREMMNCARDYGVIACPLSYFSSRPEYAGGVRISFSNVEPARLREGVPRLARFIRDNVGGGLTTRTELKTWA